MRKLEAYCGSEITSTISKAIDEAREHSEQVGFNFNGVDVVVAGDSDPQLIYRDWERGLNGYLGEKPTVGPYPWLVLSHEALASDAAIEAEHEKRRAEQQAKYAEETRKQALALQEALAEAGPIELADADTWRQFVENNQDAYGGRVVRYAEEWARLMQVEIADETQQADRVGGVVLESWFSEMARRTSHLADDDGITGFMYGCAVQTLVKCWKHGEVLRQWHNKKTQIGTEGDKANETGGVLNPAVLQLGPPNPYGSLIFR